jgi:uncharacterized protein HemY
VSFAAITLRIASQRMFIIIVVVVIYFVIVSVPKLLETPPYTQPKHDENKALLEAMS